MERGLFPFSVLLGFISFLFYFTDFFFWGGGEGAEGVLL